MRRRLRVVMCCALVLCLIFLAGLVNARVVRIKRADVKVNNLDARLEGMKVLFISDLKMRTEADARRCAGLVRRLSKAGADLMIIGGDLTDRTATDEVLSTFFYRTRDLSMRCGMYIVYGDSDILIPESYLRTSCFELLNGGQKKLYLNGAQFVVAGYDGLLANPRSFMFTDEGTGLCIVVAHDPKISTLLPYKTDSRGTPYCDLFLCGHTLGGQIRLFGKSILYSAINDEYQNEKMEKLTIPVLVSMGIGTEGLPVRFGTVPSAYILTLTRG